MAYPPVESLGILRGLHSWAISRGKRIPPGVLDLTVSLERFERASGFLPRRWFLSAVDLGELTAFMDMQPSGRIRFAEIEILMRAPPWAEPVRRAEEVGRDLHKRGEVRGP